MKLWLVGHVWQIGHFFFSLTLLWLPTQRIVSVCCFIEVNRKCGFLLPFTHKPTIQRFETLFFLPGVGGHGGGNLPPSRHRWRVPHRLPPVAARPQDLQVCEFSHVVDTFRFLISASGKCVVLDLWPLTSRQELLAHVEEGMGKNLAYRCSDAVHASVNSSQSYMIGKDTVLVTQSLI